MTAACTTLANAVVNALKAGPLSDHAAEVERTYVIPKELKSQGDWRVPVMVASRLPERATRGHRHEVIGIDVGILVRVQHIEGNTVIDPLIDLANLVGEFLLETRMDNFTAKAVTHQPIYDATRLRTQNEFLSVIRVTYEGWVE